MQLNLDTTNAIYQIRAYEPGRIQVNEHWLTHSIIISPLQLITDWPPQQLSELQPEHFAPIIALKPKIVLLGSGLKICFPPAELLASLYAQQIGVEIMDTAAACRTYTLLAGEGRAVVAGLLIK